MKKLIALIVIGLMIVAAIPAPTPACDYGQVVRVKAVYAAPVYAQAVITVPYPVYPVYGVGSDTAAEVRALRQEIQDLRRSLRAPQISPEQIVPPMPEVNNNQPARNQNADLLKVVNASCVKCHGVVPKDNTLSLITADGQLANISEGMKWKAHGLVASGEMPKSGPAVKDQEVLLFYNFAKGK